MTYLFSYQQGVFLDEANFKLQKAQNTHDLYLALKGLGRYHLNFAIKNIANSFYEDYIRYPLPGRTLYFGVEASL